jgi:hypothetical protein
MSMGPLRLPQTTLHEVAWHLAPSGLLLPSERAVSAPRFALVLGERVGQDAPLAVLHDVPSFHTQVKVFVDEDALGLPRTSLAEAVAASRHLGFEPSAVALGVLSAWVDASPYSTAAHVAISECIFGDPRLVEAIRQALRRREGTVVFAEQHLVALARLVVLYAEDRSWGEAADADSGLLARLLLAMSSVTYEGERDRLADADRFARVSSLLRNGAFNAREPFAESLGRAAYLFGVLPTRHSVHRSIECDFDAWGVAEIGLTIGQQLALGLSALVATRIYERPEPPFQVQSLSRGWVEETASNLGVDPSVVLDAMSADREWFMDCFRNLENRFAVPSAAAIAGWNRVPFEQRPFLRLDSGNLMLWSPQALIAWMTEGFYYRALAAAKADRRDTHFRHHYASLVERYSFEILKEASSSPGLPGSGCVYSEATYKRRKRTLHTPDVMIDCGTDLIFVEVFSGRLSFQSRVRGTPEDLERDITKLVIDKVRQLSKRIDDYLDGAFEVPDVTRDLVARIWPVLVTGSGLMMMEPLWDEIEERVAHALRQVRVQSLSIFDLSDLESVCALMERGHSLPDLLSRKTGGPYRTLDWRRVVSDDPHLPATARFSGLRRRHDEAWLIATEVLKIGPRLDDDDDLAA